MSDTDNNLRTLRQDLTDIIGKATTATEPMPFMRDELLPWLSAFLDEVTEIDSAVEATVYELEDVLHTENSQTIAGLITLSRAIATELRTRAGNDSRLLQLIKEHEKKCTEVAGILDEITIPDEPDPDDTSQPESPE